MKRRFEAGRRWVTKIAYKTISRKMTKYQVTTLSVLDNFSDAKLHDDNESAIHLFLQRFVTELADFHL